MPDWLLYLSADCFGVTTRNVDGVPLQRPRVTSQHQPVPLLTPICGHRAYASSMFEIPRARDSALPIRIHIQHSQKAGMHRTRVDLHVRRSNPLVETEFYSQHKLCYITPLQSPMLNGREVECSWQRRKQRRNLPKRQPRRSSRRTMRRRRSRRLLTIPGPRSSSAPHHITQVTVRANTAERLNHPRAPTSPTTTPFP